METSQFKHFLIDNKISPKDTLTRAFVMRFSDLWLIIFSRISLTIQYINKRQIEFALFWDN